MEILALLEALEALVALVAPETLETLETAGYKEPNKLQLVQLLLLEIQALTLEQKMVKFIQFKLLLAQL